MKKLMENTMMLMAKLEKWLIPIKLIITSTKYDLYQYILHMRAAPKVIPPIYLHGTCNKYREQNNPLGRASFLFQSYYLYSVATIGLFIFEGLFISLVENFAQLPDKWLATSAKMQYSHLYCAHVHCLTSVNIQLNMGGGSWKNLMAYFCFMPDVILPDCQL